MAVQRNDAFEASIRRPTIGSTGLVNAGDVLFYGTRSK
jgi:hypothetical protein